ncbi:thiol:disulfide interchange protein [Neisseria gonorrhoeae]|uniref:Thiol:disulfide interchange protein n=1 Tax=Neisseria gonorrhoeae TaxID=485 RepID=A0A379B1L2_NEIGO|nr:thiol:disulfide interchange protein [Neisseria gonorrhoeae]
MKSRHLALGVAALFALAACDSKVQTSVPADSAPAASAAAAPAGLVEGQNYTVLANPIPQQQAGKVEVLEFSAILSALRPPRTCFEQTRQVF